MKINFLMISMAFIVISACQTKKRSDSSFAQGASQEVAGADSVEGETKGEEVKSSEIVFTLSGNDESVSSKAAITYSCKDGYNKKSDLDLNEEGENAFAPYADSSECTIALNSFVIGNNSFLPRAGEEFPSHEVGETGQYESGAVKYDLLVVSQLPSGNVHYQYSIVEEEPVEELETIDDNQSSNPNQTPAQK